MSIINRPDIEKRNHRIIFVNNFSVCLSFNYIAKNTTHTLKITLKLQFGKVNHTLKYFPLFPKTPKRHVSQKARVRQIPIGFRHLGGLRRQPFHVVGAVRLLAVQPAARPQLGKVAAQPGEFANERGEIVFAAGLRPVHPADLVILAIGVIVAVLAVADLVARQQQRHALREKQAGKLIALAPPAHRENGRIVGCAFDAAIDAQIVVRSVAIVFAVGLIVLVLVAHQVFEREAVVHGDVVDAAARAAAVMLELHGRAGHAVGEVAGDIVIAAPEAAQGLAIGVVPFRPAVGEGADLVAAVADVPGLGDQLDVAQHRVLPDGGEERRVAVEGRQAAERGGEIEAEAVDVVGSRPKAAASP